MATETIALAMFAVNGLLILILAVALLKGRKRHKPEKVNPLEYEMMEHADPEQLLLMKLMSGDSPKNDSMMNTMMRDMIHGSRKVDEHASHRGDKVAERVAETHSQHKNFIEDKELMKSEIKDELKQSVKEAVRREIRKKLKS